MMHDTIYGQNNSQYNLGSYRIVHTYISDRLKTKKKKNINMHLISTKVHMLMRAQLLRSVSNAMVADPKMSKICEWKYDAYS